MGEVGPFQVYEDEHYTRSPGSAGLGGGVIVSARFTYGWLSKLWSLFGSLLLNPKP